MTNHCVSLEIAKQLKEAGWKKETEFWWSESRNNVWSIDSLKNNGEDSLSAPLATEILEELPEEIEYKSHTYRLQIGKNMKYYAVWYDSTDKIEINSAWSRLTLNEENEKTLSNSLGLMWLYLKKEGLLND